MSRLSRTPRKWHKGALAAAAAAGIAGVAVFGTTSLQGYITASKGSSGGHVKCVQKALNGWAKKDGNKLQLKVDGVYGVKTSNQVFLFQQFNPTPQKNGKVDRATSKLLAKYATGSCKTKLRGAKETNY